MKILSIALCTVLPCTAAAAQERERGDVPASVLKLETDGRAAVSAMLDSGDAKERAWGAHLCGEQGLAELSSRLVALAASKDEDYRVRAAALDALIRSDAEVAPETIESIYDAFPSSAVVLLAKHQKGAEKVALSLAGRETNDERWLALCNMLGNLQAPGFAAALLSDLHTRILVSVSDRGNLGRIDGGGMGMSIGCGFGKPADGFPPFVDYKLTTSADTSAVVFARGPRTVYCVRRIDPGGDGGYFQFDRDPIRVDYLLWLLDGEMHHSPEQAREITHERSLSVTWTDAATFQAEIRRFRGAVEFSFTLAVKRLEEKGLVSPEEAKALEPHITVHVEDLREDRSTPLPDIAP